MVSAQTPREIWTDWVLTALNMGVHVGDHVRSLGLPLTHAPDQRADADVAEPAVDAQGEVAGFADLVLADPVVGVAGAVSAGWSASADRRSP